MSNSAAARSDDPPPGPSDTPAAKFTELRALLVGPEQRQLHALQTRLEDPAAQARDVSRVLATAVELRTRDPHLQRALAPTIEDAITASVRRNPRPLADALFPIIGPAIRKAIAATLNGMLESLNTTLEHSLSWRSLQWRLDARRSGRPFAEIVLLNTLVYRVEQVFLIHRPSGLLLQHLTASGATAQDADMVSGMLTAIRDFVQDSFKVGEDEGLQTLKVGDLSVWIEQGPHALLAVVVRGAAPPSLRTALQQALESGARAIFGSPRIVRRECGPVRRDASAARSLFPAAVPRARAAQGYSAAGHGHRGGRAACGGRVDVLRAPRAEPVEWLRQRPPRRAGRRRRVHGPGRGKIRRHRAARSAGLRSRLAAAVPQSWTRLGGEPLGAVSGAAPVDRDRPCPPAPGTSRRREPRVQGWRAARGGIGTGRMD